jgi:hypothetical protein
MKVYENQRRFPFVGWSTTTLPNERKNWSTGDGATRSVDLFGVVMCCTYVAYFPSWSSIEAVSPRPGWQWAGPWRLDTDNGASDGWEFAFDFGSAFSTTQNKTMHNVRRRAWLRGQEAFDATA